MADYEGTEQGILWTGQNPSSQILFIVRPPKIPAQAFPLFDEETRDVIGFREEGAGIYRTYDLEGNLIEFYEKGLESPLFDPIDLVLIFWGMARVAGAALFRAGAQVAGRSAARSGARIIAARATGGIAVSIAKGTVAALRASYRRLLVGELKFTAKTISHMNNPDRYVPVLIQKMAILYGKRTPDPRGFSGVFRYVIPMTRKGEQYTLEVVLRKSDNTVLHFMYFH